MPVIADKGLTLSEIRYAIVDEETGYVIDGARGWALGLTEAEAWSRAIEPCEDWSIRKAKDAGMEAVQFFRGNPQ